MSLEEDRNRDDVISENSGDYGVDCVGDRNLVTAPIPDGSRINSTDLFNHTGSRNVINGCGENSGTPKSAGDWNSLAKLAYELGALIEDTTNEKLYYGTSGGNWATVTDIGTSSSASPGFGTWIQVSADRPAIITADAKAVTDEPLSGEVAIDVDESGGTTRDYRMTVAYQIPTSGGDGEFDTLSLILSAGAQYQVVNKDDPNSGNQIGNLRLFTL